ncbi:DUF6184 family natural product biosynthesis lipoprotein [Chondromyces crocatus]|uniref:Uncharacterized protein n=1 Tax=Chondromyces crocatus TaxID=52 RepID=A0A0K1E6T2_CHOCO|nr:DUF6184 family natural product biosynthesis lipoprotein [Chondromyces crocatus]AKT36576.1 uncharacterized protein CMC5_006940 [Chondromyces crocatus]
MKLTRLGGISTIVVMGVLALGCRSREEQALGTERERPVQAPPATPNVPPVVPHAEQPHTQQPSTGMQHGAGMQAGLRPANQIAQARCEQMQRCGNIAQGKKYANMDACLSEVRRDWQEELNAYECPGGYDQKELSECLSELRNETCNSPLSRLSSVVACRSSDICE